MPGLCVWHQKLLKGCQIMVYFLKWHLKSGKISVQHCCSELMLNQKPLVPDMKQ